jgi:hypothetical protein
MGGQSNHILPQSKTARPLPKPSREILGIRLHFIFAEGLLRYLLCCQTDGNIKENQ